MASEQPTPAEQKVSRTPLPVAKMTVLAAIQASEAINLTQLLPYVPFMVQDFLGTSDADTATGTFAGLTTGMYIFSQLFSASIWGWLSDKYGRRPILMIGCLSNAIFLPIFGFSQTMHMAILLRFATGFMNGNFAVLRSYLGDILDHTNQDQGFSLIALAYSLGLTVGPLIGGALYDPAAKYNSLQGVELFENNPYCFPNIIAGATSLITLIGTYFLLPESKQFDRGSGASSYEQLSDIVGEKVPPSRQNGLPSGSDLASEGLQVATEIEAGNSDSIEGSTLLENTYSSEEGGKSQQSIAAKLLKNRDFRLVTSLYCMLSLAILAYETVFPLWAKVSEEDGGYEWGTDLIGFGQSIGGVSIFIFQAFLYHRLARWLGKIVFYRLLWIIVAVQFGCFSLLQYASENGTRIAAIVIFQLGFFGCASSLFTGTFVFINNSVRGDVRGAANGLSQSAFSLFGGLGPFAGGAIYSSSLAREIDGGWGANLPFFNRYLVFYIQCLLCVASLILTFLLPNSIQEPYPEGTDSKKSSTN